MSADLKQLISELHNLVAQQKVYNETLNEVVSVKNTVNSAESATGRYQPLYPKALLSTFTNSFKMVNTYKFPIYISQFSLVSVGGVASVTLQIGTDTITANPSTQAGKTDVAAFPLNYAFSFDARSRDEYFILEPNQSVLVNITNPASGLSVNIFLLMLLPVITP